ncbi:MAG: bifunctional folylpolyglutamate synthase/dihydrofolate synthase, partial [Nioella sp.]
NENKSHPHQQATLPAEDTVAHDRATGLRADAAQDVAAALAAILDEAPGARVLICGSLYLAGVILRDHG